MAKYWIFKGRLFEASLEYYPSCLQRGPWRLLITANEPYATSSFGHFPRWYFSRTCAEYEAKEFLMANGFVYQDGSITWEEKEI